MTVKSASLLAFVGMLLLTILMTWSFIRTTMAIVDGLLPALAFVKALIYLFASLAVTAFFFVFHRRS
jgi:predicted neutral ceramidase superfamily lipid hydrolase